MFEEMNLPRLIIAIAVVCAVLYYFAQRKKSVGRQIDHDYFSRVWLWPPGSHTRWEAELDLDLDVGGVDKPIGFYAETTHQEIAEEEPTAAEVAFCKDRLGDLDGLFHLSRSAVEQAWTEYVKREMPHEWRSFLSLNGISVPKNGDMKYPWGVTYFCEPAKHYFSIEFRNGAATLASVDG